MQLTEENYRRPPRSHAASADNFPSLRDMYTACVLGATGSVGSSIVKQLIASESCGKIITINRREVPQTHPKVEAHVVDITRFDDAAVLASLAQKFCGCDSVFMTLGVGTPSKVSKEELKRVDYSMPVALLKSAADAGVRHASVMTAAGADSRRKEPWYLPSTTGAAGAYYSSIKGKVEDDVNTFRFPSVAIFQPSTLLGAPNTPKIMETLAPSLRWVLPENLWDIHIDQLACAMIKQGEEALSKPAGSTARVTLGVTDCRKYYDVV